MIARLPCGAGDPAETGERRPREDPQLANELRQQSRGEWPRLGSALTLELLFTILSHPIPYPLLIRARRDKEGCVVYLFTRGPQKWLRLSRHERGKQRQQAGRPRMEAQATGQARRTLSLRQGPRRCDWSFPNQAPYYSPSPPPGLASRGRLQEARPPTGPPHPPGAKTVPTSGRGRSPTALNLTGSL